MPAFLANSLAILSSYNVTDLSNYNVTKRMFLMQFTPDKRDASTIKVIDGRKRLIGTIQHAAGRCIVTDCRDATSGLVLRNELEAQQYFSQFNWSSIVGRTDGDVVSHVVRKRSAGKSKRDVSNANHQAWDAPYRYYRGPAAETYGS
jgi:hypothetical protein